MNGYNILLDVEHDFDFIKKLKSCLPLLLKVGTG